MSGGTGLDGGVDRVESKVVDEICAEASSGGQFAVPANLNAPGQIVIAGHTDAVRRAIELAKQRGSKMSVELNVSAPFHCALMQPGADGMRPVLEKLAVRPLRFGVIANVTGAVNRDHRRVVPLLLEQITAPVRWEQSMASLAAQGVDAAIEIGCGRVLSGMMRRINKSLKAYPLEDLASLKALQAVPAGA